MRNRQRFSIASVFLTAAFVCLATPHRTRAADAIALPETATVIGTVQAAKPFKAAKVYLMNVDKPVLFMVYTSAGRYRAVNLFPGN